MIHVLIVDDSAFVRKNIANQLALAKDIRVIGAAPDPYVAREMIVEHKPDVVLLDVEMPRMDGLSFLEKLMTSYPLRVIVVSSLAQAGGDVALRAIELGALEVIAKPGEAYSINEMGEELIEKIRAVASVSEARLRDIQTRHQLKKLSAKVQQPTAMLNTTNKIIALGASTGGTEAIQEVLQNLPLTIPPIIIVQHMPEAFTRSFAKRLNQICHIEVAEAKHMDALTPGRALIAPGNAHVEVRRSGAVYYVKLDTGPLVNHHRPSVDVLFKSVAKTAGKNAVGIILTGMGRDGAQGMLEMKEAGSFNIAQNEHSSIVYGMPKEAVALGGVDISLPLKGIAQELVNHFRR